MAKELFVYSPYKSKFEEQVSSGAVDGSQIGIIAETGELWVKGTYLPIVDLSNKADISKGVIEADGLKDGTDTTFFTPNRGLDPNTTLATQKYVAEATTNFAKDLTGVIEASPEEFTYRPSAGNKSIRDASAVIRRIKGNTVVFAQLSDHASSLQREGDWSVAVEVTANTWGDFSKDVQVIAGHKYLFYINKKDGRSITDSYTLLKGAHRVEFDTPLFITAEETALWRWTARYQTSTNGLRFQTQAFDLTRLFDAGNEPTTMEEFKSSFPDSYYPYSEPEVRNVITNQITTIGLNQWDEQWELGGLNHETGETKEDDTKGRSVNYFDVLPSTPYFCHTIANTTTDASGTKGAVNIVWYDRNKTFIRYQVFTNRTLTSPRNARYAKIYTVAGDVNKIFGAGICINLSHSGVRNGEYEPYKRNIRTLPEIYKYFPDGMNGVGEVYDEINSENAITRIGRINLGTLNWEGTSHNGVYAANISDGKEQKTANIITHKYPYMRGVVGIAGTTFEDKSLFNYYNATNLQNALRIYIKDTTYSDVNAFKESIQGVYLYYELLEPIVTPITEPIQLDYVVDDFGTEKASAFGNSAPFRADIVYQFNAEGRIRDNSRNIERIENTITDRLIPSQTAMLGLPNKVMTWNGSAAMMSLPIAESIADWEMEESPLGVLPTGGQVKNYVRAITDKLIPTESAPFETQNRVMIWNGDYAMTSLPIAANFAQWEAGAIPTGQQVMDYISAIKGSLATGLIPKETLEIGASGLHPIVPNKAYEITTASSTEYNIGLEIVTTSGVDVVADNEWRIRIDARRGFRGSITIEPLTSGYSISWAYPEDVNLGAGTAPTIKANFIYDIQFRMIGKTLIGSYKKYR